MPSNVQFHPFKKKSLGEKGRLLREDLRRGCLSGPQHRIEEHCHVRVQTVTSPVPSMGLQEGSPWEKPTTSKIESSPMCPFAPWSLASPPPDSIFPAEALVQAARQRAAWGSSHRAERRSISQLWLSKDQVLRAPGGHQERRGLSLSTFRSLAVQNRRGNMQRKKGIKHVMGI